MTIRNSRHNTSYYSQWHHLRQQGIPVPDPHQQLLNDLSKYITSLKNGNTAIIVAMDANESYTERHSKLFQWMMELSLVDLHMALYELDTYIPVSYTHLTLPTIA